MLAVTFTSLTTLVTILGVVPAFGQASVTTSPTASLITTSVDKSSYTLGDTIVISGQVQSVVVGTPVAIQIFDPNNSLVQATQVYANPDGTYVDSILITGPYWISSGTYTIKVQYGPPNVTAQTTFAFVTNDQSLTVRTDLSSYNQGDTIVMTGHVSQPDSSTLVTLRVSNANQNLISVAQVLPATDGSFTKTLLAIGPLWVNGGTYTIVAQYGKYLETTTTFYFNGGDGSSTFTKVINSTYSLQAAGQTYNIPYIIKGGTVSSMNVLPQQYTLEITLNTNADGSITVTLPRNMIDAKIPPPPNPDANLTGATVNTAGLEDDNFIVTVNGKHITQFSETKNQNVRILSIPFHNGDTKIDIVGTQIVSSTSNPSNTFTGMTTVTTDKASYKDGDTITISGTVNSYIANTPATIRIIDPRGDIVKVDSVDVGSDRTFSTSITATGTLWQAAGTYQVQTQYGSPDTTSTTIFQFAGSIGGQAGNTIKVDGTDLSVKYSITNGKVFGIKADNQSKSLIVSIQTTGDGVLTITLPRGLIDTQVNGQDDHFYVQTNGQEANFQETSMTTTDRTISIPFTDGTSGISIIGTNILNGPSNPISLPTTPSSSSITSLVTDKPVYDHNSQIMVTGHVANPYPGQDVAVKITSPSGNVVSAAQLTLDNNGNFVTKISTVGNLWFENGQYTIQVQQIDRQGNGEGGIYSAVFQIAGEAPIIASPPSAIPSTPVFTPTQHDIENINQARANQTIAAEVNVGANQSTTNSIDNNVSVQTTSTTPDSLNVNVSASSQTGPKVIAFNLNATTINVTNLKDLGVMYDGKLIQPAPNMDAILHAKPTDSPSFAIVVTQSGVQVLVLVPHFSTHSITIMNMSKVIPAVPEFPFAAIVLVIATFSIVLIPKIRYR